EAAQLDAIAARHGSDDLVEDGVDDVLHIALIEMRIGRGDPLNQLELDHRACLIAATGSGIRHQLLTGGCQSANRPSRLSRSTACTAPHSLKRAAKPGRPTASSRLS